MRLLAKILDSHKKNLECKQLAKHIYVFLIFIEIFLPKIPLVKLGNVLSQRAS